MQADFHLAEHERRTGHHIREDWQHKNIKTRLVLWRGLCSPSSKNKPGRGHILLDMRTIFHLNSSSPFGAEFSSSGHQRIQQKEITSIISSGGIINGRHTLPCRLESWGHERKKFGSPSYALKKGMFCAAVNILQESERARLSWLLSANEPWDVGAKILP